MLLIFPLSMHCENPVCTTSNYVTVANKRKAASDEILKQTATSNLQRRHLITYVRINTAVCKLHRARQSPPFKIVRVSRLFLFPVPTPPHPFLPFHTPTLLYTSFDADALLSPPPTAPLSNAALHIDCVSQRGHLNTFLFTGYPSELQQILRTL